MPTKLITVQLVALDVVVEMKALVVEDHLEQVVVDH
jgi:hypothetical protein